MTTWQIWRSGMVCGAQLLLALLIANGAYADHPAPMSQCNAHVTSVTRDSADRLNIEGVSANCDEININVGCWKKIGSDVAPDAIGNWQQQVSWSPKREMRGHNMHLFVA